MDFPFVLADVFTSIPFSGNQLAVISDARGLSGAAMQAITREFNFPESTFVLPPADPAHAARVRIFTPRTELPFAGHPTVGTAAVLAHLGRAGEGEIVLEEGIGPVRVRIRKDAGLTKATLLVDATVEMAPVPPAPAAAASALSLPVTAVLDTWAAAVGPRFCFIHLADARSVDAAVLDHVAWSTAFASAWSPNLFFFSGDTRPSGRLYARMFAPAFGIPEDPATGSAAASLAGTLAARVPGASGTYDWTIEQGVVMGRPSLLEASATTRDGGAMTIAVGGHVVIHSQGTMTLPASVAGKES